MLLDREAELRRLQEAVSGADRGVGGVVLIEGGFGSGRTSLMRAAAEVAAAAGMTVLRAAAAVVEQDFDHGVARQLFDPLLVAPPGDRWLAGVGGVRPPALSDVAVDGGEPLSPQVAHRWIRELQQLLETVAADAPVAVLVDDLQWVDPPSLRWLAYLAGRAGGLPVVVVATVLDGDPRSEQPLLRQFTGAAVRLPMRPLPIDAVRAVVHGRFGTVGDAEFVTACHEVSGGNPSVLDAILAEVVAAGGRPVAAHADTVRAARPARLRERLVQCVRGQDGAARRYLRAMAVLGERVGSEPIQRLSDLDPLALRAVRSTLVRQGLLTDDVDPRFAHALVREAAATTVAAEREELHVRSARLLHELGRPAADVARHLLAVAVPLEGWATEVLRAAAHRAVADGAADAAEQASRYLRRALLDEGVTGRERGALLVELSTVERAAEPTASVRHISQALPLLTSAGDRAMALARIDPSAARGAPALVQAALRRAADELGDPDDLDASDRAVALRIRTSVRRMEEHRPAGLAASCDLLRATVSAPDRLLGTTAGRELAVVLLHAATLSGRLPAHQVADLGEQLMRITPACGAGPSDEAPRTLLVMTMVAADRPGCLEGWLDPHLPGAATPTVREMAMVCMARGQLTEVQALPADSVRAGPSTAFGAALVAAAIETRTLHLASAVHECGPGSGPVERVTYQMARAAEAAGRGERGLALECFLDCGRHLEHLGWRNPALFPWRTWAAALHVRRGEPGAALELADEELALAREWGAPAALGRALRVRGSLLGGAAGGVALRAAVDVLGSSANLLELARAEVALGRHLCGDGEPTGEDLLLRGRRRAGGLGAAWLAGDESVRPVRAGGTGRPDPAPATGLDLLTRAERRVVERAMNGATNQMIADELSVGLRVVEKHLTSAYRKLGVRGRGSLGAVMKPRPA